MSTHGCRGLLVLPQLPRFHPEQLIPVDLHFHCMLNFAGMIEYLCSCRTCKARKQWRYFGSMAEVITHLERDAGFRFVQCGCGDKVWAGRLREHRRHDRCTRC